MRYYLCIQRVQKTCKQIITKQNALEGSLHLTVIGGVMDREGFYPKASDVNV